MKKPTAGFASGGGLETFSSLLEVSPRAGSGRSRRNRRRSRSRNNGLGRHRERALCRERNHTEEKITTIDKRCQ
jgi:hypothetical protein